MKMRGSLLAGLLLSGLCGASVGCGGEGGTPPVPNKTVPEIPLVYDGRPLSAWRAVPASAPEEERVAAAFALATLETEPTASAPTLRTLLDAPEASVRLAACVAAGRLAVPDPEVATRLVACFDAAEEPLRRHAREAAGALGEVAVEPLLAALSSEKARVRWGALIALSRIGIGDPGTRNAVLGLARADATPSVRRQALFTLARLGPDGVLSVLGFLDASEATVRQEAAAAVLQAGADAVEPVAALLADPDEERAALAGGILADLGPLAAPALPALLKALERPGPVRFNAAEALIGLGPAAVAPLEQRARSEDEGMAAIARYALDEIDKRK